MDSGGIGVQQEEAVGMEVDILRDWLRMESFVECGGGGFLRSVSASRFSSQLQTANAPPNPLHPTPHTTRATHYVIIVSSSANQRIQKTSLGRNELDFGRVQKGPENRRLPYHRRRSVGRKDAGHELSCEFSVLADRILPILDCIPSR